MVGPAKHKRSLLTVHLALVSDSIPETGGTETNLTQLWLIPLERGTSARRVTLTSARPVVRNEAAATGVGLGRAHLAGVPPGATHGGTAQGLGADDATKLALAHLVGDGGKAGPSSVICGVNGVGTHTHM